MYLSRLQLNANHRLVWREVIGNPYNVHQMVMRGFPGGVNREQGQVLHRLEMADSGTMVLVQSALEPDWSTLNPDYLAPASLSDFLPNPAVKPFTLPLRRGQVLGFRLTANPTLKKGRWDEATGKTLNSNRVPLVREDEQRAWLDKRAEASGFTVLDVAVSQGKTQKMWKKRGTKPITLYTVQFNGYLRVASPETLTEALQKGIGPAKAFGCGLLSLARAV